MILVNKLIFLGIYSCFVVVLSDSDYSIETSVVSQRNSFEIGYLQKVTTTSEKMSYFQSPSEPFSGPRRLGDL